MSFTSDSKEQISLKKLVGKAHTKNEAEFYNESKKSGITINANTVFAEDLPSTPGSGSQYQVTSNIVEYIRLPLTPLQESVQNGRYHAFSAALPSTYESDSNNQNKGNGIFNSNSEIHASLGKIQLVPNSFGDVYEVKVFKGGDAETLGDGTNIPVLDDRKWYFDYFNGILFQQNPPDNPNPPTAPNGDDDHLTDNPNNPSYIEAYVYIGKMASERFSEGGGGSGNGASSLNGLSDVTINSPSDKHFLVSNSSGTFINRVISSTDLQDGSSILTTGSSISSLSDVNDLTNIQDGNVLVWNASNNRFEFAVPAQTYTDEMARNAAGLALSGGTHTGISFVNDDSNNVINASLDLSEISIGQLSNIDTTGAADGKILKYNNGSFEIADDLDTQLSDNEVKDIVGGMLDGTETGISVSYDSSNRNLDFVVSLDSFTIDNLSNVDTSGITNGQVLKWNGTNFVPSNDTGKTVEEIQDIIGNMVSDNTETGITVTYVDNDEAANINGKLNFAVDLSTFSINDLSNVDINTSAPTNGQVLKWNGTNFVPQDDTDTNTQLSSNEVKDIVGDMLDGTETGISVSYDSSNRNLDFVVSDISSSDLTDSSNISLLDGNQTLSGNKTFSGTVDFTNSNTTSLTPTSGDNSTKIATTAFITTAISNLDLDNSYQPKDNTLTQIAAVETQADQILYTTNADTFSSTNLSSFGREIIGETVEQARETLGLGTAAFVNTESFLSNNTALGGLSNVLIDNIQNAQILVYDSDAGTDDNKWKNISISGDVLLTNTGAMTIQENAVENSMILNSFVSITDGANTDKINLGETITFAGTNNQIEVSTSSDANGETLNGQVTISLPNVVEIDTLTVSNDLNVSGNLTVSGTSTTLNTQNLDVEDSVISLNNGLAENVDNPATNDIGFFLNRGDNLNTALIFWDEGDDVFKIGTHSGNITSQSTDLGDSNNGFSYAELQISTVDQNVNNNTAATTSWVTSKINTEVTNAVSNISTNDLTDVDTSTNSPTTGQVLKLNSNGVFVPQDESNFVASTASLWEVSDDGTELFPHGIIDGTLDTGMFAIELSTGSVDLSGPDTTLHDIVNAIQNMNAYTLSTRPISDINDTYWEFVDPSDPNSDIMPKAAV